jgi:hypothetical protein
MRRKPRARSELPRGEWLIHLLLVLAIISVLARIIMGRRVS